MNQGPPTLLQEVLWTNTLPEPERFICNQTEIGAGSVQAVVPGKPYAVDLEAKDKRILTSSRKVRCTLYHI